LAVHSLKTTFIWMALSGRGRGDGGCWAAVGARFYDLTRKEPGQTARQPICRLGQATLAAGRHLEGTTLVSAQDLTPAVRVITTMGHLMANQLRALDPKPLGLVNDVFQLPAFVGSHRQSVSGDAVPGLVLPGTLTSVTLCYGIREDPLSPYLEVLTDFTRDHGDTVNLRSALGAAVGQEKSRRSGQPEREGRRHRPPSGPPGRGRLDIGVAGRPRTVHTQSYEDFHGLQFSYSGLIATVIARGQWPDHPAFDLVTDLEAYLTAMESPDSEVVKAKLRAR
jgi:hypothetical protein